MLKKKSKRIEQATTTEPAARLPDTVDDPVIGALEQATALYLDTCAARVHAQQEMQQAQRDAAAAREARQELEEELEQTQGQLAQARARAEANRARAEQLAAALKNIHRALFSGNVFELILRACIQLTSATRGLYIASWGDRFRVRAAVDVDGYPQAPLSPYLEGLCRRALERGEPIVCSDDEAVAGLPAPGPAETFRNCLVAPAVLRGDFSGLVLLADKASGDFTREDAELVLSVGDQAAIAVENQRLHHNLIDAYFTIVGVLADAVETKDSYIHGHCELVARLARLTAQRLGLAPADCSVAFYGGLLHDVGKIGVSDGILNKPGRLTPEEWDLMRSHVRLGRDLLARVPQLRQVADVVLHHHERFDGTGYPDGLKGDAIPMTSRIVGAADAYCAMVTKRSYKEATTAEEARAELERCQGSHFDPRVVAALLDVLKQPEDLKADADNWELGEGLRHPADFRYLLEEPRSRAS
jgi:putative nucleotidyltransferase with HDIG domain